VVEFNCAIGTVLVEGAASMVAPTAAKCCEEDGSASTESPDLNCSALTGAEVGVDCGTTTETVEKGTIISTITISSDGSCAKVNTAATQAGIKVVHRGLIVAAVDAVAIGTVAVRCVDSGSGRGRRATSAVFSSEAAITLPEGNSQATFDEEIAIAVAAGVDVIITDTAGVSVGVQVSGTSSEAIAEGSNIDEPDRSASDMNGVAIGIAFWCVALSCIAV
jgi:hypothetical protein